MAHIVRTNGVTEKIEPDQKDGKFSLQRLQELVGGYIQLLPIGAPIVLDNVCYSRGFCDEQGKLKERTMNTRATILWYGSLGLMEIGPNADYLVGDILFVENSEGD